MRNIVVLSGARTAIGDYGGALKDLAPATLAAIAIREAITRASVDSDKIGHLVAGHVIPTEAQDMYLARVAALEAGLPQSVAALTLNRVCGSGLQAIISAAQAVMLGDTEVAIAAGAESMSRGGYLLPALRWGQRMQDSTAIDMMVGALTDPFDRVHMGITAENIAESMGATAEVEIIRGYPVTYNSPALTTWAQPVMERVAGKDKAVVIKAVTGAEDFSFFSQKVPGFFFFVGGMPLDADPTKVPSHHTPDFFIDESGMITGLRAMLNLTVDYMKSPMKGVSTGMKK